MRDKKEAMSLNYILISMKIWDIDTFRATATDALGQHEN